MSSTAEAVVRAKELGMQAGEYIKSWYGSLPLFTSLVLVSSLVIQIVNFISFYNLPGCLSGEVYFASPFLRLYLLLSNPFLHRGWLHLIFNSIAFAPLGGSLEKSLGSLRFLHLLLLFSVLISVVYLTLTFFVGFIVKSLWSACVEGLSGLIFAYISAESSKGEIGSIE
ncbi:hypothetical protein DFJ73DRAFT_523205 [Zopfochytrium polystomum]|nr:hypothetical protein DFJ73DRAFT_523205 [Zopfochytrium polystomum]